MTVLACVTSFGAAGAGNRSCPLPHEIVISDFTRAFVQTRHLKGLAVPLVSEGTVSLHGERIEWHNLSPFDILTTFGPDGITQSVEGSDPQSIDVGGSAAPLLGILPLPSLLRGNLGELEAFFRITTSPETEHGPWTATLVPLDDRLAEMLGAIEITGCAEVERVTMKRPGGDYDVIQLSPLDKPAGGGSKAEKNAQ